MNTFYIIILVLVFAFVCWGIFDIVKTCIAKGKSITKDKKESKKWEQERLEREREQKCLAERRLREKEIQEEIEARERAAKWEAQTDPNIKELQKRVKALDYEKVFEMLDKGIDPNLPIYYGRIETHWKEHILDDVSDEAMIKLLRSYGAKSSQDMRREEEEKRLAEKERKELEHKKRSDTLVENLLNKRQLPICG